MKKIIASLLTIIATFSYASGSQENLEATAVIEKSCVLKYGDLNFGLWDAFGIQDKNFDIGVKCNPGVSYTLNGEMAPIITSPDGKGVFAFILPMRRIQNPHPTQYLGYRIMYNNGQLVTFGNGSPAESGHITKNLSGLGTGEYTNHAFIGRVWGYRVEDRYVIVEPGLYAALYNFSIDY